MTVEWTREEEARFPEETRVMLDKALECAAVEVLGATDVVAALRIAESNLHPYEMRDRNGSRALFGVDLAYGDSYSVPYIGPRAARLEAIYIAWAAPTCPLAWCEMFDFVQRVVPVATPKTVRAMSLLGWEDVPGSGGAALRRTLGRVTAVDHARGPVTVSSEQGESEITSTSGFAGWLPQPGDQVDTFFGVDRTAVPGNWSARTLRLPRRPKPSRVPSHVSRHERRLDGRRRS